MMAFVIASLVNLGSAWLFLKFFQWTYAFVPSQNTKPFMVRFILVGILTVPLLLLITILWLPRYFPSTGLNWLDELFFSVFSTGLTEEGAKFAVFVFFAERWKSIREPRDGVLQAACVALAFSTLENFKYMLVFGPDVMGYRLFFSMAGHIGFTAIAGWAWATIRSRLTVSEQKHALRFSLGYISLGAILHGFYNFFISIDMMPISFLCELTAIYLTLILLKEAEQNSPFRRFSLYEWREAAQRLIIASAKDPLDWVSRERAGLYLIYGGDLRRAIKFLGQAARLRPLLPYPRAYLAAARILRGNDEGLFQLKLAYYEMSDDRRGIFARTLRKIARNAPGWSRLERIIKESTPTVTPTVRNQRYATTERKLLFTGLPVRPTP